MKLVAQGDTWVIKGRSSARGRIAYAVLEGAEVRYSFTEKPTALRVFGATGTRERCATGDWSKPARSASS